MLDIDPTIDAIKNVKTKGKSVKSSLCRCCEKNQKIKYKESFPGH